MWDALLPAELLVLPIELGRVDALLDDPVFFARAPRAVAAAVYIEVRQVRETIAAASSATAVEPPARLRGRVLAVAESRPERRSPWRATILAAASAIVIGLSALASGLALWAASTTSTAEQVFAARDVAMSTESIPTGGTATAVYSRDEHAAVLVMNDVAPPAQGTVYQVWLLNDQAVRSAGTLDAAAVSPSTTAVIPDLGESTALKLTVEPGGGSAQPTGELFAKLPLT